MKLYDYPGCPFGKKVRIVLAEKDLSFETQSVDLAKGEQRSAEFRQINPFGKVPVLEDEGATVYESSIINEYLNDEYPHEPELLPEDSGEKARVRLLADLADRAFTLPLMALEREAQAADKDEARAAAAREVVAATLARLDKELAEHGEYLAGDFTLADVAFAPGLQMLAQTGVPIDASLKNVAAWKTRLLARPSVVKAGR